MVRSEVKRGALFLLILPAPGPAFACSSFFLDFSVTFCLVGYQMTWAGMNEAGLMLGTMALSGTAAVVTPAVCAKMKK
jgi:hypothetical protein